MGIQIVLMYRDKDYTKTDSSYLVLVLNMLLPCAGA